jgi:hypothetical protein
MLNAIMISVVAPTSGSGNDIYVILIKNKAQISKKFMLYKEIILKTLTKILLNFVSHLQLDLNVFNEYLSKGSLTLIINITQHNNNQYTGTQHNDTQHTSYIQQKNMQPNCTLHINT